MRRARFGALHARRGALRDAEPVGRRLRQAAPGRGLRGARDDEPGARLGAREARHAGDARRARGARRCARGATAVPLNVDSERCFPDDAGGVAETVRLLATRAPRAARSRTGIRRPDGSTTSALATERVAEAAEAARARTASFVLTGRAENHLRGVDDLDDTIARLVAYRDAGATASTPRPYDARPGRGRGRTPSARPSTCSRCRQARPCPSWPTRAVRRVSTGSLVAGAAYAALEAAAGSSSVTARRVTPRRGLEAAPRLRVRLAAEASRPRGVSSCRRLRLTRSRIEIIPTTAPSETTGRCRNLPSIIRAAAMTCRLVRLDRLAVTRSSSRRPGRRRSRRHARDSTSRSVTMSDEALGVEHDERADASLVHPGRGLRERRRRLHREHTSRLMIVVDSEARSRSLGHSLRLDRRPFARAPRARRFDTVRQRLRSSAAARLSIRRSRWASSAWRLR